MIIFITFGTKKKKKNQIVNRIHVDDFHISRYDANMYIDYIQYQLSIFMLINTAINRNKPDLNT